YTKVTYGLVALAFLVFMLFDARQRRWAAWAIGLTILTALAVEAFWKGSASYLADLRLARDVGGILRGTWGQILDHILGNLADYVLLTLFAGLAVWRTRSLRDVLFYVFCGTAGFFIINQNFQAWGIITLHAAAAVAAETVIRHETHLGFASRDRRWSLTAGVQLLFLALVLPTIVHCSLALGLHAVVAGTRAGEEISLPNVEGVRLVNLWTWGDHDGATTYLAAVQDGADVLDDLEPQRGRVFVLDLANPFSMAFDMAPARGDMPRLQWDRTVNASANVPPEVLLDDVEIVMEPKAPAGPKPPGSDATLQTVYGPHIAENFDLVRETEHWRVHRRKPVADAPPAAGAGSS
ncbi:hypothetical protein ACFOYU_15310, partial [Microvirga sp. GCM10011540]